MDKDQAKISIKNINSQLFSLNPSSLVTLFEIDASTIAFDLGISTQSDLLTDTTGSIFRFHNNNKLLNTSIFWQGREYFATPIQAEGFEVSSKGTLPTPLLSLSVSEEYAYLISIFKNKIRELQDLTNAKVTRIRTLACYLDKENFIDEITPDSFYPDPNAELSRDIYYIDRKSNETKTTVEFELGSILDVQGVKLPGRLVVANKCLFSYRGAGCLYENRGRKVDNLHGKNATLPVFAPAIATEKDELISDILNIEVVDKGEFRSDGTYVKGDCVFIQKNDLKYYFVAKQDNPIKPPPNLNFWISDNCSRTLNGCRIRWQAIENGTLPFGSFPSVNRLSS